MIRRKKMKKLLLSFVLLVVSIVLACVMLPLGILWTIGEIIVRFLYFCLLGLGFIEARGKNSVGTKTLGYLSSIIRSIAVGIDQIGNSVCRDMLNRLLIVTGWYSFGKVQETISSVLGKNQKSWTLTRLGRVIVAVLDFIDKDHCKESIQDFGLCSNPQPPCGPFIS